MFTNVLVVKEGHLTYIRSVCDPGRPSSQLLDSNKAFDTVA